ncbi:MULTISPECIES: hypothetical protein [Aerosakkonema]
MTFNQNSSDLEAESLLIALMIGHKMWRSHPKLSFSMHEFSWETVIKI